MPPIGRWGLTLDEGKLNKLRCDPRFHRAMTLAHILNSLRFAQAAAFGWPDQDAPAATRQRAGAFFYLCGLLDEGLNFAQHLGQHFRELQAYGALKELLAESDTKALRAGLLDRMRNNAVFHNNEEVVSSTIPKIEMPGYEIVSAQGNRQIDIYYPFADAAYFAFTVGDVDPSMSFQAVLGEALSKVLALSTSFAAAAEGLLTEELLRLGVSSVTYPTPGTSTSGEVF